MGADLNIDDFKGDNYYNGDNYYSGDDYYSGEGNDHNTFPNASQNNTTANNVSIGNSSNNRVQNDFRNYFYSKVIVIIVCVIFIFGAVGNGYIIWLLGFRIKRNPFITYILNLAVADLGVLLSVFVNTTSNIFLDELDELSVVSFHLILLMYSASQFFVSAISIDRCVAVFFPLWYQCHRPPHLTTIVCALIWVFSILLTAISSTLRSLDKITLVQECYQFIANAVLCLPVMTIATMCLFIKFCFKAQQYRRGRLLTIVLLTLLFFLLFGFPLNIIYILSVHKYVPIYARFVSGLLACLNSSVNPVIYFLVARQRKARHSDNMETILQRAFKEVEICTEETTSETRV